MVHGWPNYALEHLGVKFKDMQNIFLYKFRSIPLKYSLLKNYIKHM